MLRASSGGSSNARGRPLRRLSPPRRLGPIRSSSDATSRKALPNRRPAAFRLVWREPRRSDPRLSPGKWPAARCAPSTHAAPPAFGGTPSTPEMTRWIRPPANAGATIQRRELARTRCVLHRRRGRATTQRFVSCAARLACCRAPKCSRASYQHARAGQVLTNTIERAAKWHRTRPNRGRTRLELADNPTEPAPNRLKKARERQLARVYRAGGC